MCNLGLIEKKWGLPNMLGRREMGEMRVCVFRGSAVSARLKSRLKLHKAHLPSVSLVPAPHPASLLHPVLSLEVAFISSLGEMEI